MHIHVMTTVFNKIREIFYFPCKKDAWLAHRHITPSEESHLGVSYLALS